MKYFQDVVDFVEDKFRWVILTFLVAVVLEIIFFLIRSLKGKNIMNMITCILLLFRT